MVLSITTAILTPVIALLAWSSVMWAWMYITRIPAIQKAGMEMNPDLPNGQQMSELPAKVRWKADNYNHLQEQPTMFYAVAISLALLGAGDGTNLTLAWAYVAVRIIHSLHQSLWNKIELRFAIFSIASVILITLIVRAAMIVF
jgi:hypothetical protein